MLWVAFNVITEHRGGYYRPPLFFITLITFACGFGICFFTLHPNTMNTERLTKIKNQLAQLMKTGTVKFFDKTRAYGFITAEDSSEVFFHITGCANGYQPKKDDKVKYLEATGKKGIQAKDVSLQ